RADEHAVFAFANRARWRVPPGHRGISRACSVYAGRGRGGVDARKIARENRESRDEQTRSKRTFLRDQRRLRPPGARRDCPVASPSDAGPRDEGGGWRPPRARAGRSAAAASAQPPLVALCPDAGLGEFTHPVDAVLCGCAYADGATNARARPKSAKE